MAAVLSDANNAAAKDAAYTQAHAYLGSRMQTTGADRFADANANRSVYRQRLTYGFPRAGAADAPMTVPKGAEVLLETRLPYLDAEQRRVVLRTTGISSGYPLLDDAEGWGRLDLVAAADGYGEFRGNVIIDMDAAKGGFYAQDRWRNDIGGNGKLVKRGTGTLILTGQNSYTGGTQLEGGTLEADSDAALGSGTVYVVNGNLVDHAPAALTIGGDYAQLGAGTLTVDLGPDGSGRVVVHGTATIVGGQLHVRFRPGYVPAVGDTLEVLSSARRLGKLDSVVVDGFSATAMYTDGGLKLHIDR